MARFLGGPLTVRVAIASIAIGALLIGLLIWSPGPGAAGRWEQLPDPPLAPRATVNGVWTGEELLLVGGDTFRCNPSTGCAPPTVPALSDGAALNPRSGQWRPIVPAPLPIEYSSAATIGPDAYFLSLIREEGGVRHWAMLRYSIPEDSWAQLPWPHPQAEGAYYTLLVHGGELIAYSGNGRSLEKTPLRLDVQAGEWDELPPVPALFQDAFTMFSAGDDLFVTVYGSEPATWRLAADGSRWESIAYLVPANGALLVEDGRLYDLGVSPGGSPFGNVIDPASGAVKPLPLPGDRGLHQIAGLVGAEQADLNAAVRDGGSIYFTARDRWRRAAAAPEAVTRGQRLAFTAGRDAIVFGGVLWPPDGPLEGELLGDAWISRAPY